MLPRSLIERDGFTQICHGITVCDVNNHVPDSRVYLMSACNARIVCPKLCDDSMVDRNYCNIVMSLGLTLTARRRM